MGGQNVDELPQILGVTKMVKWITFGGELL